MSPWTKWMRTTLLSSLIMYSMLSRLIALSPTRSNLLMIHLLPPKSRARHPEGYPGPVGCQLLIHMVLSSLRLQVFVPFFYVFLDFSHLPYQGLPQASFLHRRLGVF